MVSGVVSGWWGCLKWPHIMPVVAIPGLNPSPVPFLSKSGQPVWKWEGLGGSAHTQEQGRRMSFSCLVSTVLAQLRSGLWPKFLVNKIFPISLIENLLHQHKALTRNLTSPPLFPSVVMLVFNIFNTFCRCLISVIFSCHFSRNTTWMWPAHPQEAGD